MTTANPTKGEELSTKVAKYLVAKGQPIIKAAELESIFKELGHGEKELRDFTSYIQSQGGKDFFRKSIRLELWKAGYRPKEGSNPTVTWGDKKWDELWEITKKAFERKYPSALPGAHHDIVKRAFREGKPIPIEVTLDYPDIFPGPKPKVLEVEGVGTAIDAGIADVIRALNNKGYKTYMSCSGLKEDHPGEIEREQGYVVFLTTDLSPSQLIEIKEYASSAGLKIREKPERLTIVNDFESDKDKSLAWLRFKMLLTGL